MSTAPLSDAEAYAAYLSQDLIGIFAKGKILKEKRDSAPRDFYRWRNQAGLHRELPYRLIKIYEMLYPKYQSGELVPHLCPPVVEILYYGVMHFGSNGFCTSVTSGEIHRWMTSREFRAMLKGLNKPLEV